MKQGFETSSQARQALCFHCPRWAQLPEIALYMDQVTGYVNDIFRPLCADDQEPTLTKAMVNNYVKLRVLRPPENKKYSRDHLAYLVVICALKQLFSIPEIARQVESQTEMRSAETAYDEFCQKLEDCLREAFLGETIAPPQTEHELLALRAAQAWADKMYLQKRMEYEFQESGLICRK